MIDETSVFGDDVVGVFGLKEEFKTSTGVELSIYENKSAAPPNANLITRPRAFLELKPINLN